MSLHFPITGDNKDLINKLNEAKEKIKETTNEAKKHGDDLDSYFTHLRGVAMMAGSAFAVGGLKDFVTQIATVRGEFQQLEIAFTTMLGNRAKADQLMREISETAASTPFDLQAVAGSAKQLLSFGVASDEVIGTLTKLGDIASGLSIPLSDLVYLYGTTLTQGRMFTQDLRQFQGRGIPIADELAKQFGVAKSEIGDLVTAGKVGAKEFTEAIDSMASGKFNNLMQAQSQSITGQISNLEDQVTQLFNELGKSSEGVISGALEGVGFLLEHYKEIGATIGMLVTAYGAYKAAQIAHVAMMNLQTAQVNRNLVAETAHRALIQKKAQSIMVENAVLGVNITTSQATALAEAQLGTAKVATASRTALLTGAIRANTMAVLANAKAMLTNPYVLVAMAVTGLVYGVYKLSTSLSHAEQAQENFNERQKEFKEQAEQNRSTVEGLVQTLQSSTATTYQQAKAWEALVKVAPELANAYGRAELSAMSFAQVQKIMAEQADIDEGKHLEAQIKKLEAERARIEQSMIQSKESVLSMWLYSGDLEENAEELKLARKALEDFKRMHEEAQEVSRSPIELKAEAELKLDKLQADFDKAQALYEEEKRKHEGQEWLIPLNIRLNYHNIGQQLDKANAEVLRLAEAVSNAPTSTTVGEQKSKWLGELAQLNKQYQEALKPSSIYDATALKALQEQRKELEDKLKGIGVDTTAKKSTNSGDDRAKERHRRLEEEARYRELQRKQAQEESKRLLSAELALEEMEIQLIENGAERRRALMEHNHRAQMIDLEHQRAELLEGARDRARALFEADKQNAGKIFDPTSVQLGAVDSHYIEQKALLLERQHMQERQTLRQEELASMNAYLKEYGTYEEKRRAIIEEADAQIAKATSEGERLTINARLRVDLGNLDAEMNKLGTTIGKMFGDLSEHGRKSLKGLAKEARNLLQYLQAGQWQELGQTGRDQHGLTREHFDKIAKSPQELEAVRKKTEEIEQVAIKAGGAFAQMADGLGKLFSAGDNPQKLQNAIGSISEALGQVSNALGFLRETFTTLGDAFRSNALHGIAEGLGVAEQAIATAQKGMEAGKMFGSIGAIVGGAVGAVTSLIGSFTKMKDARHERTIQHLQQQIERLDKSYRKLGRAVEQAYSSDASDLIRQQDTLLRQKQALLRAQISEENAKKKTDGGKIKAWQNEIDNISEALEENARKAKDAIFGSDVKSAINDFATAYAEAWAQGNDRAESAKDFVKKQIRAMIMEAIKAKTSQPMQAIRDKMAQFFSDGIMTATEQATIDRMAVDLSRQLDGMMGEHTQKLLQEAERSVSGSSRGFQTMSQDTASELNGRFTAIQQDVRGISLAFAEVRNLHLLSVGHLENISRHTAHLGQMSEQLATIEKNTRALR